MRYENEKNIGGTVGEHATRKREAALGGDCSENPSEIADFQPKITIPDQQNPQLPPQVRFVASGSSYCHST